MRAYVDEIETPAGPVAFAVDEEGALVWLSFTEGDHELTAEEDLEHEGYLLAVDPARTARVREQLIEYTTGERREFDLPLAMVGSAWQKAVWRALTEIPYGETRSYAEIAAAVGRPGAARAVGRANATNRLPLVVPCHRVISADGTLGGFNGGLHLKERLLEHESRVLGERV